MDCKENSSHLSLGEAHLFHPRSLDMGISIGNCCGSNGDGDANGVIINSLQGPGGTNLSISNKENVTVTGQEEGGGGGLVKQKKMSMKVLDSAPKTLRVVQWILIANLMKTWREANLVQKAVRLIHSAM